MAKLPSFKRIVSDTLTEYADLQEPVFNVLNSFMENVNRALNKRLTFAENFDSEVITVTDDGQYPLKISWNRVNKPVALLLGKIERKDGADVNLAAAVSVEWKFNQSLQIEITDMVGLGASSSDQYILTLIGVTG